MKSAESFVIFPFVHSFHNLKSIEAAFQAVNVPDVCPGQDGEADFQFEMSMQGGEFCTVYKDV